MGDDLNAFSVAEEYSADDLFEMVFLFPANVRHYMEDHSSINNDNGSKQSYKERKKSTSDEKSKKKPKTPSRMKLVYDFESDENLSGLSEPGTSKTSGPRKRALHKWKPKSSINDNNSGNNQRDGNSISNNDHAAAYSARDDNHSVNSNESTVDSGNLTCDDWRNEGDDQTLVSTNQVSIEGSVRTWAEHVQARLEDYNSKNKANLKSPPNRAKVSPAGITPQPGRGSGRSRSSFTNKEYFENLSDEDTEGFSSNREFERSFRQKPAAIDAQSDTSELKAELVSLKAQEKLFLQDSIEKEKQTKL
jgi:hypothetical protein